VSNQTLKREKTEKRGQRKRDKEKERVERQGERKRKRETLSF
jgi:hypothetical protein